MDALSVTEGRLRALFAAGLAVTSELSLDALLNRLVEAAAELTGARYAALGVIDANGLELEQFIIHGIDDDLRAEIGDLPRGRGILGVLIREARPPPPLAAYSHSASVGSRLPTHLAYAFASSHVTFTIG